MSKIRPGGSEPHPLPGKLKNKIYIVELKKVGLGPPPQANIIILEFLFGSTPNSLLYKGKSSTFFHLLFSPIMTPNLHGTPHETEW